MIGKLKGIVDEINDDHVLVDVNGVGYVVFCSDRTLVNGLEVGQKCILFIETYVREDQFKLFGFVGPLERDWFLLLQSVQGIGAKLALAVLSKLTPAQLTNAIALQDKATLSKTPGVGPKAAERIVLELKNKLPKRLASEGENGDVALPSGGVAVAEAISALTNLGYSKEQAAHAIATVVKDVGPDAENTKLIRLGLRELAK